MNECKYFEELISCGIDGELIPEEAKALREHLAVCPSCRTIYNAYGVMFGNSRDNLVEPPEALKENILRSIGACDTVYAAPVAKKEPPRKKSKGGWIKYAAAAACLALIIFAVPSLIKGGTDVLKKDSPAEAADEYVTESVVETPEEAPAAPEEKPAEEPSAVSGAVTEESGVEEFADRAESEVNEAAKEVIVDESANNHCTIYIFGELPARLADFPQVDNGDGTFSISIYEDTALDLIGEGYGAVYTDPDAPNVFDYTVIYSPADE